MLEHAFRGRDRRRRALRLPRIPPLRRLYLPGGQGVQERATPRRRLLAEVRQDSFDKDGTETPERSDQQAVPALERDRRKGNGDHRQGVPLEASARRHGVSAAAELAAPFLALPSVSVGEAPDDQTMTAATLAIAGEGERPRLRPCGLGPLRRGRSGSAADTTGAAESDSSAALERFN